MEHLVSNIYIQFVLFILSAARISRLAMEDKITRSIRNVLLYRKYENGQNIEKENLIQKRIEIVDNKDIEVQENYPKPKKYVLFFRDQFSCSWCLPFWITSLLLTLTIIYPTQLAWFNLYFASAAIVSHVYDQYM